MVRILGIAFFLSASITSAQNPLSVSRPMEDNSVEAELKSFQIDDRYSVSLFADESLGIANPVCFEWDANDRLWVLCTWAYPQLKPDAKPNDKLFILEDTDQDGRADKASTFVDGLNMPTGFALGHGGVYIGEGHDLIHVKDTDGDGKADRRELLFTGFGTGDTHQNINSFAWTPGGELLFCQGLHCFSHVQTPWGNVHLEEHGSWRLRPLRRQLNSFRRTSGGGNPWGYAFGEWGEPFIKSNGTGVSELLPAMVQTDHIGGGYWGGAMTIGGTKIKSMIIEIVDSPHLPDDLQGDFLIAGYFARNIGRLRPGVNGAGHKLETIDPLLTSSHNAFRPVDLNIGPDGALYVLDWFNPIIGHYQASLRHPDRDEKHGRIWRITAKNKPLLDSPKVATMTVDQLCWQLAEPLDRTRHLAKRRLMDLPKEEVIPAVEKWVETLKPGDPNLEHNLFEAIGVFESHEVVNRLLLERLLRANDYRARAYATRVCGRWNDRMEEPLDLLRESADDVHPRVRLEAIVAACEVRDPDSIAVAARAADESVDPFINYALLKATHSLSDLWTPALTAGDLAFQEPEHLVKVVGLLKDPAVIDTIRQAAGAPGLSERERLPLIRLLAILGNRADAESALKFGADQPEILRALTASARERNLKPPVSASEYLGKVLADGSEAAKAEAINLCAAWNLRKHGATIESLASSSSTRETIRVAAVKALSKIGGGKPGQTLEQIFAGAGSFEIRIAALSSLAELDIQRAATLGCSLIAKSDQGQIGSIAGVILSRQQGADALASAMAGETVNADQAKLVRRWMNSVGRSDAKLVAVLDGKIGAVSPIPNYSGELVARLAKDALEKGDAGNGKVVFQMPLATCTSCHEVDGIDGAVNAMNGPNLSSVAAGLPIDLLIESVLWPGRQIKEGYSATTITTKDGAVLSGFAHSRDEDLVGIRDLATGEIKMVPVSQIKTETKSGTMMPPGLTSSLTEQEFLDLIKFLSTLKTGSAQ